MSMNDINSISHTKWNCKYHIVFAPKFRRKVFYREKKAAILPGFKHTSSNYWKLITVSVSAHRKGKVRDMREKKNHKVIRGDSR